MKKQRTHFVDQSLMNAVNPIVVNLIGAGGTGSHMVKFLANLDHALVATGKPGLHVKVFDHDLIERPNFARSDFNENYLGMNKAVGVVNFINRSKGLNWKAIPESFCNSRVNRLANLTICCVDTVEARKDIVAQMKSMRAGVPISERDRPMYILDLGNAKYTGQVLLSTIGNILQPESEKFETVDALAPITEEYAGLLEGVNDEKNIPSCSVFESLQQQSLSINSTLASIACHLLSEMLTDGMVSIKGFFLNLETFRMEPILV